MSNLPELTGIFSLLASHIEPENPETNNETNNHTQEKVLITSLNQSLNLGETCNVSVLDTTLSLMCFTPPQVFDLVSECSVTTIVSVLSGLVDCKVIGGSGSGWDCVGVMEACGEVLGKLNDNGMLSFSLLYAVVRVAVMNTTLLDVQQTNGIIQAMSKLMHFIPKMISLEKQELELRLLLWYLDPQNLVKDVSEILQNVTERPFICLNEELYEKMEWRSIVICLAFSPLMLTETRALLHRWFLLTGLDSVLELQVELVSTVLDLLSRPMWWGLSAEVGSKLPFSNAYFFFKHQLFRSLAGPLSCGGFLELVQKIKKLVSYTKKKLKHVATTTYMVDHKSTWAMVMNFPDWFHFAALLLSGNTFIVSYTCKENVDNELLTASHSSAAAWYISWILEPVNESVSDLLAKKLEKLSMKLIKKHSSSYEYTCQTIRLWLEEFQGSKKADIKNNLMFRRIMLGISIGCYGSINEDGFELLLHYVATGSIIQSTESQHKRRNSKKQGTHKEAVSGACTVFHLTDIAERMSDSIFETRENAVDFIYEIKLKSVKYMLKCVKRLLEFESDQYNDLFVNDLHRRMLRWRSQGKDVFHGRKDFDDAVNVIVSKLRYS